VSKKPKITSGFSVQVSKPQPEGAGVTIDDFCAYMPLPSAFFFTPCRELWPGSNIDKRLPRVPLLTKAANPDVTRMANLSPWIQASG
jgi:hypothetical protein